MQFDHTYRLNFLKKIENIHYDLIIVGGGVTGAGIFLEAASRGMKVLLVEKKDFASGTSSRSTKLIHGGLRYLKQLEFKLVATVGKERKIVQYIAPHITKPVVVSIPVREKGSMKKPMLKLAMWFYEWLSGVKKEEKFKSFSREQTIQREPLTKEAGLKGSVEYFEYYTDDARLTLELIKTGVRLGGVALNYCECTDFLEDNQGKIEGIVCKGLWEEHLIKVKADRVIASTGPWTDTTLAFSNKKRLILSKGVHLSFRHEDFPLSRAVYFDVAGGRMIFAIPKQGYTYVGTTDTYYEGDIREPGVSEEDINYILRAIEDNFNCKLSKGKIASAWSGLRPLIRQEGKSPSEVSRKDEIFEESSGLIAIAGGKLTGYRQMALKVLKKSLQTVPGDFKDSISSTLKLTGGKKAPDTTVNEILKDDSKLSKEDVQWLVNRLGSESPTAIKLAKESKYLLEEILPISILALTLYSIKHEAALNLTDFFIRRSSILYFDTSLVEKYRSPVTKVFQSELNWTEEQVSVFSKELDEQLNILP